MSPLSPIKAEKTWVIPLMRLCFTDLSLFWHVFELLGTKSVRVKCHDVTVISTYECLHSCLLFCAILCLSFISSSVRCLTCKWFDCLIKQLHLTYCGMFISISPSAKLLNKTEFQINFLWVLLMSFKSTAMNPLAIKSHAVSGPWRSGSI